MDILTAPVSDRPIFSPNVIMLFENFDKDSTGWTNINLLYFSDSMEVVSRKINALVPRN